MKRSWCLVVAAIAIACATSESFAELSSNRPVRMLVASAPGGPSDLQIRLLVPVMSEVMGQTLIVDNRPSANGVLATGIASKANPDGHTFTVGNSGTHAVNALTAASLLFRAAHYYHVGERFVQPKTDESQAAYKRVLKAGT